MNTRPVVIALAVAALAAPGPSSAKKGDIHLAGQTSLPNSSIITDVWGYVDPATHHEYAVVGDWNAGVYIVDVTNPASIQIADHVSGISGFDVKVWDHYVYACDGDATGDDGHIIDIADPRDAVLAPSTFPSAHNIAVTPGGIMYLQLPGLRIYTLGADPLNPAYKWRNGKYGHDATPSGNRVFDFTGSTATVNVWQVNNVTRPTLLGTVSGGLTFAHSGDVSADGNTLYVCDELATHPVPDITVWDISDPANASRVAEIADADATVHNLYVADGLAFVSYYTSGFKVFDLSDPRHPTLADSYDTTVLSGEGFDGAFGVYPFTPSGRVYVTDEDNGLYVFEVERGTQTPVQFTAFEAQARDGGVALSWRVSLDDDLVSFQVTRRDEGGANRELAVLPATAHSYFDTAVAPGNHYTYAVVALHGDGTAVVSLEATTDTPRATTRLFPGVPNPFNPSTTIAVELGEPSPATLVVYDARGRRVRTLHEGPLAAGRHRFTWDGTTASGGRAASGTYFCRLTAGSFRRSERLVLVK